EDRDAEVEKITGKAAKADHIASRTIKAINLKMQDDPIFYTKFADLIRQTIEDYHQKRIDEAEYLKKAKQFDKDFFEGNRDDAPKELANNEVALAFYNYSKSVYKDVELLKTPFHIEMGLIIDRVVKNHIYLNNKKVVDWHKNLDITGKIKIELGDAIYDLLQKFNKDTNWDDIDHLIEECVKIAIHRYK
ncbi:MAG TPA: hypothetical protein VJ951_06535, partial [Bacteroidales bacterium]|nr:hypothetical protein [Bacteroidales bacterium]